MSSKSPGPSLAQRQQLLTVSANNSCCPPGEFHHHNSATSPDGDLVVTRTLSGLSDVSCSGMSSRDSGYCVNTSDGASTCSSSTTDAAESEGGTLLVLEPKSLRSFTTNDEYLYAMKEDLADWFACLYKLDITAESFFPLLETGVLLCQHANKVQDFSQQRREQGENLEMRSYFIRSVPLGNVPYRENVKPQTFQARDNVSNFIAWGKKLGIPEVLSFETDDLVLRKNEKNVILCLLEIARVGAKLGMLAPTLVQMEEEIDAELAGEEVKPKAQIKTCDMRSLDEMVRDLIGRCTCPVQFPMVKVGDGKYKIGDSRSLIFVRILRNHVMVRVGGGWDTLENYLNKHDPCQCNYRGHRATSLGPGNTPKSASSTNQQRSAAQSRSVASGDNSSAPRFNTTPTKVVSPRRMSQPAVAVTTPSNQARHRSTSPKQLARSKSPTLIISRHTQGNLKPSFSVSNNKCADSASSLIAVDEGGSGGGGGGGGGGMPMSKGSSTGQNNGNVPNVTKSWSQASGVTSKIPSRNGSKSPSPAPSSSRLRSPSPLNSSPSGQNLAKTHPHKFARASSSSAILSKGRGQGSGGEVKVGTPRSIKRAAMNSKYEDEEEEEEDDEEEDEYYGNDDADDGVYDDENYRWRDINDPGLQFNCADIETDNEKFGYILPGSVSFEDSCDGTSRSRSSLERVSELDTFETSGDGKKSNMPMEKINTMTLTEFKSLLSTALSAPEEQQQQYKQSQNSYTKPSSLAFSTHSGSGGGITSTASTPGASDSNKQLNWDALRDKARLVRDSISSSVNSRKGSLGNTATGSPGIGRRSLPQSPDDDGSRHRVAYTDGNRPKTPQSVRRSNATTPVSRPKTPTSAISRPKTPTSIARPKTPSSMNQSRSKTPSSMERNTQQREEYKMARPKTPSQMKREAVAKVAGAISNWVESRNELDSTPAYRSRPKTPVSSQKFLIDDNEEDNAEIMGTLTNNHVDNLASSIRDRPCTPSRIPKPCFTPRPVTPKMSGNGEDYLLSTSTKESDQFRPTIPIKPPQSLSLSQQNNYSSPYDSTATTPDTDTLSRTSGSSYIPATKNTTRSQYQPAQSAPATPGGGIKDNRSITNSISNANTSGGKTYKDMYVTKRATTPTQLSSSIPRSQPSRCVTPGPREKWSLGERSSNSHGVAQNNSQSRISSYQNGKSSSKRRGSLSNEHVSSNTNSNQFVVTNEITFSDDEEINEMLKNAAMASASEKQERKPRSASVDARRLVRQNANAKQRDVVVISRNNKGKHSVQVTKQNSTDSNNSNSVRARHGHSTDRSQISKSTAARFRSQTPDPSMFRRKLSSAKSVGSDDIDAGAKSGNKSINRTEAWVDSTLSDTKRKLPPRPKRANTIGTDIPVSELAPRPLEEIIAILPEQQDELIHVDTEALDAPAEDPEMYKKMEKLFEKYREMELRASVNEVPGGGKLGVKKSLNPSSATRSFDASSKSTPSVASMKTSSGSVGSSSGRSSSHQPTTSFSQQKVSSEKSVSSVPSTGSCESSTSNRYSRASSVPKTFQKCSSGSSSALSSLSQPHQRLTNQNSHSNDRNGCSQESENSVASLKDIDAATAKNPTALISKIKEILRVRPRKDGNGKIPTRIPAPASLNRDRRSKSVSNLLDQVAEMTMKDNNSGYSRSNSNSSQQNGKASERLASSGMTKSNSSSNTNIAYSEFVFSDKGEEADSVSDFTRTWSVQSDSNSSDSNNRCETPVPKLATPLTTGRSTFINRKLERSGRGLSNDKENGLSNSQSSLSSRSALSTTEDEADYV